MGHGHLLKNKYMSWLAMHAIHVDIGSTMCVHEPRQLVDIDDDVPRIWK